MPINEETRMTEGFAFVE
jgi:translation initiation factor 3 subunit B